MLIGVACETCELIYAWNGLLLVELMLAHGIGLKNGVWKGLRCYRMLMNAIECYQMNAMESYAWNGFRWNLNCVEFIDFCNL